MGTENIKTVIDSNSCTGCCACEAICPYGAITVGDDQSAFIISHIDMEKCIRCGKCRKVCPALCNDSFDTVESYAAVSSNRGYLMQSSSGGIFPAIAEEILFNGGIVYGATMNEKFKVSHIRIDDSTDLIKILGSKYIQSYMGGIYERVKKDLDDGRTVLFSGTPCIVSAVRNYCKGNNSGVLLTVDIVCHGVPSQCFFDSYIDYMTEKTGNIDGYKFRAKRYERNGMNCFFSLRKKPGAKDKIYNWPEDPFNYMYMKSYIYRESCYKCRYATAKRAGDITLCDFWGWEKYHNEFPLGTTVSGVLINSKVGMDTFDKVKGRLFWIKTEYNNIRDNNSCLVKPSERPRVRETIIDEWNREGFETVADRYGVNNYKTLMKAKMIRWLPAWIIGVYNRCISRNRLAKGKAKK